MSLLDINNLNLGFECECGFRQALWDISLSLNKGETHALVGESGCGKSITAMSIIQLLPKKARVISGEINFENENLLNLKNKQIQKIRGKKIALIPQDPMTSLDPLFTVGEQLLEVIKIHQGLSGKEAWTKAIDSFETVQIPCAEERLKSYPHEFSGGMKQRAIIAMALACKAEIIIADEPTTALDVTIQAQIMDLLTQIKKENNTSILFITHDLAVVKEYADTVSVMYAGRIVEHAPAKEFFQNTKHPYSKALLAALPSATGEQLETISGQPPTILEDISGCRFHPRCKFAMDICKNNLPDKKFITENHYCNCFLYE